MHLVVKESYTWMKSSSYRYGMLAVLVAFVIVNVLYLLFSQQEYSLQPLVTLAISGLLLLNHVVASFLSPLARHRFLIPQMLLTTAIGVCVVMMLFRLWR